LAPESSVEKAADAASFAALIGAEQVSATGAPSEVIGQISARLKAGEITAAQATELLVDAVVRARVPSIAADLQDQLRATLHRLLAEDPMLAAKVRRLTEVELSQLSRASPPEHRQQDGRSAPSAACASPGANHSEAQNS
jgi:hypothetical protein